MALKKFSNCTNDLLEFERVFSASPAEDNVHALEVLRVELDSIWTQVKRSYEECRDNDLEDDKPIDKNKLRERYHKTLSIYKICLGSINAEIQAISKPKEKTERQSTIPLESENISVRLPPCDTDIFFGDYKLWPSFRDLFTAIYIKNSKLSNVERLFYLTQKTGGEAREIITHVPLTNDGFVLAWKNLIDRYENKWMQVNEQYKIILDLPQASVNSGSSIKKLQRTINDCRQTLTTLGIDTKTWESFLIYICSQSLPRSLIQEFENSRDDCAEIPTWAEFDKFLTHKFKTLESVGNMMSKSRLSQNILEHTKPVPIKKHINSFQTNLYKQADRKKETSPSISKERTQNKSEKCPYCKESHLLRSCPPFLKKNVSDRIHVVRTTNACYNCLSTSHGVKECPSKFSCRVCKQKHNTLLHKSAVTQSANLAQVNTEEQPSTSATALASRLQSTANTFIPNYTSLTLQKNAESLTELPERNTLLFTALVQIEVKGLRYQARAIIDPGSQSTFVSDKLQKCLSLPTKRNLVHVTGLNQTVSETSTKACLFNLCSRVDPSFNMEVWAPVLKTLPSTIPTQTLNSEIFNEANKLELADPHLHKSRPIDLLIGLDLGPSIYCMKTPMRSIGPLLAQKTVFGWIVGGPILKTTQPQTMVSLLNTTSLDKILTRFWEVEETPKQILRSDEDTICKENFKSTTRRDDTGRYIVTLPFKKGKEIGTSRNIAMAQYLRMERMLSKKPEIKQQYNQAILEYLELGHMKKISPSDINKAPNYYLPHHAVIKPERLTTKLRVVFNASSPTSNKNSLNDILYPGPILQQDLVLLIAKWRFFRYVFNADITKMYRQIFVDPSQTRYQRILFRRTQNDPIEDYELLTVTFGVNCAPFLAIRTLLQLAEEVQSTHPSASNILQQHIYVDDALAGGHTLDETIASRKELSTVLESAGFDLRKWASNDPRIIHDLPKEKLLPLDWLNLSENDSTKTLGIKWIISSDSFTFTAPDIQQKEVYTKREVLSTIARFFDPCGWLAPIIVEAKLIMQQIWLDKVGWDDVLRPKTEHRWKNFVKNCPHVDTIKIPRWIHYNPPCIAELHGFSDASEKAYAAVIYIRISDGSLTAQTSLLASKTRVAPLKNLSLPRLELCGAVLLAQLAASVLERLRIPNLKTQFWTDSTIVLSWLNKPPCHWNTFVGNRVSEILRKVGTTKWMHIDSKFNPADLGSRGCSPAELERNTLWWNGPSWLQQPEQQWPVQNKPSDTKLESKSAKALTVNIEEDPLSRFSSLPRALRVISYVLRFWRNTGKDRQHLRVHSTEITPEEIQGAKTRLIILTQKMLFSEEYSLLKNKKAISPKSKLLTLTPFLDRNGIIRANGRLTKSTSLTYNERCPVLLPYESRLAKLITEFTHKITLHGGNQLMIRIIRAEFWIFKLKQLVKTVINNCKTCIIYKKHTQSQIMASLPPERTTLSRPFTVTGVDYAGPFDIRNFTGRACLVTKGYVCIFVCFATKAIHLEAASDLSTQAFLAAFSRFIGRRGCPACVYSDNGKNFVGAAELIKKDRLEFMKTLHTQVLQQQSHQNIEWKFIPPGAPHMGGLWEAGVKSFKAHLRKMIPHMKFTFEELSTILVRIEACLNSRPLSPASDDPNDLTPLTPGHFLIGTPIMTPPERDLSDENVTLANRWKRIKIIYQSFCQRWKVEYLAELHRRYKWKFPKENVRVNDLVIIKDNNLPSNEWKLGRVIKTYLGHDNNVRVVDIRTAADMSANLHPGAPHWQWSCGLCKQDHALKTCRKFLNASADERYDVVILQRYCINCLARSHQVRDCKNEFGCRVCTRRHNTLLHDAPQLKKPMKEPRPKREEKPAHLKTQSTHTTKNDPFAWRSVFVPTATVKIANKEKSDNWVMVRALIDPSKTTTNIAASTVKRVGIQKVHQQGHDFAIVHTRARNVRSKFNKKILALITEDLPRRPYTTPIRENPFEEFSEDTLADLDPRSNTLIEIELGSDVYPYIRRDGAIDLEMGHVVAQQTCFGYIFSGPAQNPY